MNLAALLDQIKNHPRYEDVGMVLSHNGVVRSFSRDGRKVSGLSIQVDRQKLAEIVAVQKNRPGIVEILVDIVADGSLSVGDDVMFLVVAGDVRENVIATLSDTLNQIKATVTSKTEFFIDQ
jgi:molybdopterin synthase catalytic subunit